MSSTDSVPLANLFVAVEDLLKRVADSEDPTILRIRANVRAKMIELKGSVPTEAVVLKVPTLTKPPAIQPDRADWRHPALAVLTGAAVALTIFRIH